jgi:hypothetical protein
MYAEKNVNLMLRLLRADTDEDCVAPYVLIEAPAEGLMMLADLLIALASDPSDDGFQFSPTGAGNVHFSPESEFGLYLHRTDTARFAKPS